MKKFWKIKNPIFSKTAQPILMAKILYVIDDATEIMQKIQEPIRLIRTEQKKLL